MLEDEDCKKTENSFQHEYGGRRGERDPDFVLGYFGVLPGVSIVGTTMVALSHFCEPQRA